MKIHFVTKVCVLYLPMKVLPQSYLEVFTFNTY